MTDSDSLRVRLQAVLGPDVRVDRELGQGGMAVVFLAHDVALQRDVAIKVLHPELVHRDDTADRFIREARTVASLQHPHVVSVYGVRSAQETYAIVMQYVAGQSLEAILEADHQLPLATGARLLAQVAAGLAHAHARGVIHRDVKPANVLVDDTGHAYVSDFGIARRNDGLVVTRTGVVMGSFTYMAPEQRAGEKVTEAADQYALGVMAFEVLTGRLPFVGTADQVLRAHMETPPPSLRSLRAGIPSDVDALVLRMLAKDPADRWPTLAEAAARLNAYATLAATPKAPRRTGLLVGVAAVLLGATGLAWFGVGRRETPIATPATTGPSGSTSPATAPNVTDAPRLDAPQPVAVVPGAAPAERERRAAPATAAPTVAAPTVAAPTPTTSTPTAAPAATATTTPAPTVNAPPSNAAPATAPPAAATSAPPSSPPVATEAAATVADARLISRRFVTLLNQRQPRSLAQLASLPGDAARAELLKLVESAPDFAAGFDRIASAPEMTADGFETECTLDLEWRGGRSRMLVRLLATRRGGEWTLSGFAASRAP